MYCNVQIGDTVMYFVPACDDVTCRCVILYLVHRCLIIYYAVV
jgi:hypothetical protein